MLARVTTRERVNRLEIDWRPKLRNAFLEAVEDIRNEAVLSRIVNALRDGDIEEAVDAMGLNQAAISELAEAVRAAFIASGMSIVAGMPVLRDRLGRRRTHRFDPRSPEAEEWLRLKIAEIGVWLVDTQKEIIRRAFFTGIVRGDSPARMARNVIGKPPVATGGRRGAIVGLTAAQAELVEKARAALLKSPQEDDEEGILWYLGRAGRDKTLDKIAREALDRGVAVPREQADRMAGRYADRLLEQRADSIAGDLVFAAIAGAADSAYGQTVEQGIVFSQQITKTWKHTAQENPRIDHAAMNGQTVMVNEAFTAPDGTRMQYPKAPGTPAKHYFGCKCFVEYRISLVAEQV